MRSEAKKSLKTYSHLAANQKIPNEYEITTTKLHYYTKKGFEVNTPISEWYKQHQKESKFTCEDWEGFSDPRQTTYTSYTNIQKDKEVFVKGIFQSIDANQHNDTIPLESVKILDQLMTPLLFPLHGFQMISAYIAQMAPASRITITGLLQSADEMRRIQNFAYWMKQFQGTHPSFGSKRRELWQNAPEWQPLREAVENLLITYDWGEAFTGLNLCLKPIVDIFLRRQVLILAKSRGEHHLHNIIESLWQDSSWQQEWSRALVQFAAKTRGKNQEVLKEWLAKWLPFAERAIDGLCALDKSHAATIKQSVFEEYRTILSTFGLGDLSWLEKEAQTQKLAA